MIYLDADEFLILNEDNDIKSFLLKYNEYDQLSLNWLLLGSNNQHDKPLNTILSSYTKSEEYLDVHLKTFLNLKNNNTQKIIPHPHIYYLDDMTKSINIEKNILNKDDTYWFNINKKYMEVSAFVAHYLFQSYETYLSRKINVPRDDNGEFRDIISESEFHQQYNSFINEFIKNRYDDSNKKLINSFKEKYYQIKLSVPNLEPIIYPDLELTINSDLDQIIDLEFESIIKKNKKRNKKKLIQLIIGKNKLNLNNHNMIID